MTGDSNVRSEGKTCRICGGEPKPWEELTDGLCPECSFEMEVDGRVR